VTNAAQAVFTIGHSTHPADHFVGLLRRHHITAVADVRSSPFSRYNPQFNREALAAELASQSIRYVFLGRELGARSEDAACYVDGRVQYALLARTDLFRAGVDRVVVGMARHRIALMCAEKEPLECHRTILVSRALTERGVAIRHILSNGLDETHKSAMDRLLDLTGLPRQHLFRQKHELITEALQIQERRIAYVDEDLTSRQDEELP
jgi:uncharacterized protein (DUF488 family)